MKKLNYHELREMWLEFYKEHGHQIIPSASLVPENDGSVLFTTAGMHPLVPYLLGEKHPAGKRLANIQKCVRTKDIECVGNPSHLTFFEMMGNWSLGDYFKKEKIAWSFEFLTSPKYLNVDKDLISVTCFAGDEDAPRDEESAKCWEKVGIPKERIWFLPKSENWWGLDTGGPCGPCSEMFLDTKKKKCGDDCNPSCSCGKYIEVGNDVYMEYVSTNGKVAKASQHNVDTGMGLERMLLMCNGLKSVYETEIFTPALKIIGENSEASRIIAEHTRAAMFIISDGVIPGNSGAGYVLRRLIRRAVRMARKLNFTNFEILIDSYLPTYEKYYTLNKTQILKIFMDEVAKFEKTLEQGIKEFEKVTKYATDGKLNGKTAFRLYDTYGFPIELTQELAKEAGLSINMQEYEDAKVKHAALSTTASAGAFKGGLADTTNATAQLHTATHLLLAILREIYGEKVFQKGSNITPERLRFDFNIDHKLDAAEITEIEKRVNACIKQNLKIKVQETNLEAAKKLGAVGSFADKYGELVKVYSIGNVSCEICGGPHAENTGELGTFKIIKEESVSAGIRRIKAVLANVL